MAVAVNAPHVPSYPCHVSGFVHEKNQQQARPMRRASLLKVEGRRNYAVSYTLRVIAE